MPESLRALRLLLGVGACVAIAALLAAGGGRGARAPLPAETGAAGWRGFVDGERSTVAVGQRVIVVLRNLSLADEVRAAGGQGSESEMRRWTAAALAGQKQIGARLSREGVQIVPEFVYTRTFSGFSAALDARALALLERDPDVAGIYPVRVAYPAAARVQPRRARSLPDQSRPSLRLPGFDGTGLTIALLDTGIDVSHPGLRNRLLEGIDILEPESRALARPHPDDATLIERHATQTAGLLVGRGEIRGVAPGAMLLPIRIAGWQPNSVGGFAVYGRTDQLLAGLERAVDPDADGSALDAARIAVVGVAEPFAAFSAGPVAKAVAGASTLDTLVVAAAGNDGPAGPGYGSIGGPGGAPVALTVGASDERRLNSTARVVVRAGLSVLLDRELPLGGAVTPERTLSLDVVRPAAEARSGARVDPLSRFFDSGGFSVVAGRAALVARAADPIDVGRRAAIAGAAALLVDGAVPAGALGLDERLTVPVVGLPAAVARGAREALARGIDVTVSLGAPGVQTNERADSVAPFSSRGLAFGGGVKPELVAPGVALVTADAGRNDDRSSRYATISGSSAAAALAGGAAALVAQSRPELDAAALKGVLVGTAAPLSDTSASAQGAGFLDPGAASAAEVAATPAAIGFGAADGTGWRSRRTISIENVSTRRLAIGVAAEVEGIAGVSVRAKPDLVRLRAGETAKVVLTARVAFVPRNLGAIAGSIRLLVSGGGRVAIPWAVALPAQNAPLLGQVRLSAVSFRASDRAPAVLSVRAGSVSDRNGRTQLRPLARLDVELWRGGEKLGLLARLRDVLPGSYAFGLTGRGPNGGPLPRGPYRLRVVAIPPDGVYERRFVRFRIR
ncbi:MAG: S8 family serine peptidase [Actinobacteria bacterium]|nr:S8 family serine peptidase [Actinomycetota bacterium]